MKTRIAITAAAIIASAILQSCHSGKTEPKATVNIETIPVKVSTLQKEKVNLIIHTSGQFTTNDETLLSFKTAGIISNLKVREGDPIRKGQILATLNLTEIEAQVAQAKFAFEKADRDFRRVTNLYKDSVATLEQLQNAHTGLDLATQQLASAKFNRDHSVIHALHDGYVLRKMANEGQFVSAGISIIETNGAGNDQWILKVGLSDNEWSSVKIGDKATLTTDAYPGKEFEAEVIRKSESANASSGSFVAELKVINQDKLSLAAGLFGRAELTASGSQEFWAIPYEALLDGNGNIGYVFGTNDNKIAKKLTVEIASIDKDKVYISKGLEGVSKLIIAGSPYLKENSPITVLQ